MNAGDVYKFFKESVPIGYTRFYEIVKEGWTRCGLSTCRPRGEGQDPHDHAPLRPARVPQDLA